MTQADWSSVVSAALNDRRENRLLRKRRPVQILDSAHLAIDGVRYINFASNNYLGLTHHPKVIAAFENAVRSTGVGSGAAPLVTGQSELHSSAERAIANWKGTESSVLLSSGYAANLAVVQTLAAVGEKQSVRFLVDKLCHASLIDAVRSVADEKITFRIFPHNYMAKLDRLLCEADPNQLQVVITESIFSMDGDAADLRGIAELKQKFPFLLVLDEAHGSGVYGPGGSGYAAELGLGKIVDITIITLSKALGCVGGAVCASNNWCEAIVNFGRSYIFSTAIPPAVAAAVEASIGVMIDEPHRQKRVRELARRVRKKLLHDHPGGWLQPPPVATNATTPPIVYDSPIVPVVLGEESLALSAADQLMQHGILTVAVRPPTVPRGTSRLRITLSCDHTDEEVEHLIAALSPILSEIQKGFTR